MVPLCAVFFLLYFLSFVSFRPSLRVINRKYLLILIAAVTIASIPYIKNTVKYHNPFWPIQVPYFEQVFPYREALNVFTAKNFHPSLAGAGRVEKFTRSLFELDNREVPWHLRWTVDQGGPDLLRTRSFRMGGFWWVAVIFFNLVLFTLALIADRKKGLVLIGGTLILYLLVAYLPQGHELRYYLFIPLVWAAIISSYMPALRARFPLLHSLLVAMCIGLFVFVSIQNFRYYRIERTSYYNIAIKLGFDPIWKTMDPGKKYCIPNLTPENIFLTGPTMSEYNILHESRGNCTAETIGIRLN
jgi:hypothetical protein